MFSPAEVSPAQHGKPLYEAIVEEAKKRGLAGATVWKGFMGFGAHSRMHTAKILRLSEDLPVLIEIVDAVDKVEAFLPDLDRMVQEGLVTLERAEVILYRGPAKPRGNSSPDYARRSFRRVGDTSSRQSKVELRAWSGVFNVQPSPE